MSLKNKVAIVTGGSSGIGAAIAIKFAAEGAKVTIVGRNKEKLKNVSDTCEKLGSKPLIVVADITSETDTKKIVAETLKAYGKIDILINNAGMIDYKSILDEGTLELFDKILQTNLYSAVRLTHLAAEHLVKSKGNIINISSVASFQAVDTTYAYCVSKIALDHFTRNIALELSPKGVRVNTINPGPVITDIFEPKGVSAEESAAIWEDLGANTLLNRSSDAEEIADLAEFVASNKGRGITGSSFVSDNGILIRGLMSRSVATL